MKALKCLPDNVNLIITSRELATIADVIGDCKRLDIRANPVDLRNYVQGRIHESHRLSSQVKDDPNMKDTIIREITNKNGGM